MSPTTVLTTHALLAIGYAIPLVFAPHDFLWLYGIDADRSVAFLARLFGTALVAISAITWMAREAPEGQALDAICLGCALGSGLGFIVSLVHQAVSPDAALLGWSTVAIFAGLSVAYALLWLRRAARRSPAVHTTG